MYEQLTLAVSLNDDARFANFYAGPNEQVIFTLQQQWQPQGEPFIYLWGHSGSGLSHLLQASCHYAEGLGFNSIYLPLSELVEYGPQVLDGMAHSPLVALDNLEAIAGNAQWEEAIFHLYNQSRQLEHHLIVAANAPVNELGISLPDLRSRLKWGVTFKLQGLDDEGKKQALLLRAHHRGLNLNEEAASYILKRGSRQNSDLFKLLDSLDKISLAEKRKLTIPFIKEQLNG